MPELKSMVMSGNPPEINHAPYSPALKNLCLSMMQYNPARRPSLNELLNVPEVAQRLDDVPGAKEANQVAPILKTIVVPKNIRALSSALPEAAYDEIPSGR
jgi:hypothetical protein